MFEKLYQIATEQLAKTDVAVGLPCPQVTVLVTEKENIYVAINDVKGEICKQLQEKNDTKIVKILTVWKNGEIDLPSLAFRQALLLMDSDNGKARIYLQVETSYIMEKALRNVIL
jgi:hypothetical protein